MKLESPRRTLVVKVGTRVLVRRDGRPDRRRFESLVADIVAARKAGWQVVLVSSGAIGCGMEALKLPRRPTSLPDLQMAAAVGQVRLMTRYDALFAEHRLRVGQVLLTHADLQHRMRHLNARNTILRLLAQGTIPIINENDVVSFAEIQLGDNDVLAAMVSLLIDAPLLVLLTSTNGLRRPLPSGRRTRVPVLERITETELGWVIQKSDPLSRGGMESKLRAAQMVADSGFTAVIADGRRPGTLQQIVGGDDIGTRIGRPLGEPVRLIEARKRWIAYFHRARGAVIVDDGAAEALIRHRTSLLPVGVVGVEGTFPEGSLVRIKTRSGDIIGSGLTSYASSQIERIRGLRTGAVRQELGSVAFDEIIHRDNLLLALSTAGGAARTTSTEKL
ncbi:MAG: glutamate 5-kinase [Bdellovibrionales bacterium]|nr:glutamate 5-kinase [Bdellovibrionales bacterium]